MNKTEIIKLLNEDLKNEIKHMNFYLYHASAVGGLHAEEYKEVFLEEAASEMKHVNAFCDLIWGLGGKPTFVGNDFPKSENLENILSHALNMEMTVVSNYVDRIKDAENLGGVDGTWLQIFLEGQIEDSRKDVDRFNRILSQMKHNH